MMRLLLPALLLAVATPAQAAPAAEIEPSIIVRARVLRQEVPQVLPRNERDAFAGIFRAIGQRRFDVAKAGLLALPDRLLTATAWAQIWLAGGETPSNEALAAWLAANADAPQAEKLLIKARAAGITDLPSLPLTARLQAVAGPASEKPRATRGDRAAAQLAADVKPLLDQDRIAEAEALFRDRRGDLSPEGRTEWQQRLAWHYYLAGDDKAALRLAGEAASGAGEWAPMGAWVAGLAAWRSDDCNQAADSFARTAALARSPELASAGYYWAARADMACGRPYRIAAHLRSAARYGDSFYGLLAARALGLEPPPENELLSFIKADWNHVAELPGARRATALVEIGELGLADRELRHLAMIGKAEDHVALTYLAARMSLPATQYWLAHNAPRGITPPPSVRYPAPSWEPERGWRVDRSLVFAHALQESRFVTDATSRAGAKGVMQLMPGTAQQIARNTGTDSNRLADPSFNIEFGQTYLEQLRDSPWTAGLLPKVIAAYNAGPGSLRNWQGRLQDKGDPLLFIESIPFAETRHYVEIVLRNYWMYQFGEGETPESAAALAQGLWPRFPGMPGASAVRMNSTGTSSGVQ